MVDEEELAAIRAVLADESFLSYSPEEYAALCALNTDNVKLELGADLAAPLAG